MKFNEKLIELRKKAGLSQEELGYRLNVTRQTVSKWELGQTTPEMDKLSELSRIFNISVDKLINDSEPAVETNVDPIYNRIEDQPIQEKSGKNNKIIFIIIIIFVVLLGAAIAKFIAFKNVAGKVFDTAGDIINGTVNGNLINNPGEAAGDFISGFLNTITENANTISNILDNATESDNITNSNTQNQDMINNMQEGMNVISNIIGGNFSEQIGQQQNKVSVQAFNGKIELYAGTSNPLFAVAMLDNIITSNKTNDKKVEVKYNGTKTTDESKIKNIKQQINKLQMQQKLEITCDYDAEGYIYKVTIEKI